MVSESRSRLRLAAILFIILLDMVGVGIILPVLPQLLEDLTGGSVAQAAVIGGWLVFTYAFMQFVFSPVLGNLSDRFGRRPILLLSLTGLTLDYLLMSMAPFVWYLFVGRIISGAAGASVGTATAYMADITPPEKRTHRFGLIGAAFGLGFIIGPVIGGELGEWGPRAPFVVAAGLGLAGLLFCYFVMPESLPKERRRKFEFKRANPFGAVMALKRYRVVLWLLATLFLFTLSAQALPSVYNYFTIEVFNFTPSQIGRSLGLFGIGFAISQAFLVGPVMKRFGDQAVVVLGMCAMITAMTCVAFIHTEAWLYVWLLVGTLAGLAAPGLNGILSRHVPDNMQGELQGAVNAANSLATILGPLAATQIFFVFSSDKQGLYFPGAPFLAAAGAVLLSLLLFVFTASRFDFAHQRQKDHADPPVTVPPGEPVAPPSPQDARLPAADESRPPAQ